MLDNAETDDLSRSIEELIGDQLTRLTEKFQQGHSVEELADDVGRLSDLLISYQLRDELLERLLDPSTPEARRHQMRETLKAHRMKVVENRAETERVYARSHALLDRSARLIAKIQRQIDKNEHKHTDYALEMCGFCNGLGRASEKTCQVCHGKRTVPVYQPGVKCPRCKGDGKATIYGSFDPESL